MPRQGALELPEFMLKTKQKSEQARTNAPSLLGPGKALLVFTLNSKLDIGNSIQGLPEWGWEGPRSLARQLEVGK